MMMRKPDKPRRGQAARAADVGQILALASRKIVGQFPIRVKDLGGTIAIGLHDDRTHGKGGLNVPTVQTLPQIPTTGHRVVFWTSAGAGTGDDQWWAASAGDTRWHPLWFTTDLSGAPV
jgi:hypothetical protein